MAECTRTSPRFEYRHLKWVITVRVHTEVFNLAQWNRLILGRLGRSRFVVWWERPERADIDLSSRHRPVRVNLLQWR